MAFSTSLLIGGALAGVGVEQLFKGLSGAPDAPEQAALPDSSKDQTTAKTNVANQRQLLLAAGGQTDYTGGLGFLNGSDVGIKSLVGG